MKRFSLTDNRIGFKAAVSIFKSHEAHIIMEPADKEASAAVCIAALENGMREMMEHEELKGCRPVFARWFFSDIHAQKKLVRATGIPTSYIQQPPMDGSKAALWIWLMKDVSPEYEYIFNGNMLSGKDGSYSQMNEILEDYSESLLSSGMSVAENCARTWIYVRDVDVNYSGIVKARRELFNEWGLTDGTHYIASTGINGLNEAGQNLVCMDAYAIKGLTDNEIQYLHASSHLSPTHIYGVTFERGTALHFKDRTQILISGTASIDNKGEIVADGDIGEQIRRTFENVGTLLAEAGAALEDMAQMIVYIRDTADYAKVEKYVSAQFPDVPKVITWAPVCRPGWLVEVECIAYR